MAECPVGSANWFANCGWRILSTISTNTIHKRYKSESSTNDTKTDHSAVTSDVLNLDEERWNLPMNAHNEHILPAVSHGKAAVKKLPTILVIDDSEQLLTLLETILRQFGYNVVLANSGSRGIDAFMRYGADVVLCDLTLPDLDGWKVAQFIQDFCTGNEKLKPPFILMTGWAEEIDSCEGSIETGVEMVLDKPMDIDQLLKTINYLLDRQQDTTGIQFESGQNGMTL